MGLSDFIAGIELIQKIKEYLVGPAVEISLQPNPFEWGDQIYQNFMPNAVLLYIKLYISNGSSRTAILEKVDTTISLDPQGSLLFNPIGLSTQISPIGTLINMPIILEGHKTMPAFFRFRAKVRFHSPEAFADEVKRLRKFKVEFRYQVAAHDGKKRRGKALLLDGDFESYKRGLFSFWEKDSNRSDLVQRAKDP